MAENPFLELLSGPAPAADQTPDEEEKNPFAEILGIPQYGLRADGTQKGTGFLGELPMGDGSGNVATEMSIGVEFDGKEVQIPTLVPTLNEEQRQFIIGGGDPREREDIVRVAEDHAKERIGSGLSPFANDGQEISQAPPAETPVASSGNPFIDLLGGQNLPRGDYKPEVSEQWNPDKAVSGYTNAQLLWGETQTDKSKESVVSQMGRSLAAGPSTALLRSGAGIAQDLADIGELTDDGVNKLRSSWEKTWMRQRGFTSQYADLSAVDKKYEDTNGKWVSELRDMADTMRKFYQGIAADFGVDAEFADSFIGQVMTGLGEAPVYVLQSLLGPVGWAALIGTGYEEATADYLNVIARDGREYDPYDNFVYSTTYSIPSAILERMGVESAVGRLFKQGKATAFRELVKRITSGGLGEGTTEAAQGFLQDAIASMTVDDERELFTKEAFMQRLNEFMVGMTVGAGTIAAMEGGTQAIDNKYARYAAEKMFGRMASSDVTLSEAYGQQSGSIGRVPAGQEQSTTVRAVHYGRAADLNELDPTYHGSGIRGAEAERKAEAPELYEPRTYVGLPGYQKESGLGPNKYEFEVDTETLYDFNNDPDGLYAEAQKEIEEGGKYKASRNAIISRMEQLVKERGYKGYRSGTSAAIFGKTKVKPAANKTTDTNDFKKDLPQVLNKRGWVILTAENPQNSQLTPAENAKRNKDLERDLRLRGRKFSPVKGKYGSEENSYLVTDETIDYFEAVKLAKQYNQESVLTPFGLVYQDGSVSPATGVTVHTAKPDNYFTEIDGKYFTVDVDMDTKFAPDSIEVQTIKNRDRMPTKKEVRQAKKQAPPLIGNENKVGQRQWADKVTAEQQEEAQAQLEDSVPIGRTVNRGSKKGKGNPLTFAGWQRDINGVLQKDSVGNPVPLYDMVEPIKSWKKYPEASETMPITLSAQSFEKSGYEFTFPEPDDAQAVIREEEEKFRQTIDGALNPKAGPALPEVTQSLHQQIEQNERTNAASDQQVLRKPVKPEEVEQPIATQEEMDFLDQDPEEINWLKPSEKRNERMMLEETQEMERIIAEATAEANQAFIDEQGNKDPFTPAEKELIEFEFKMTVSALTGDKLTNAKQKHKRLRELAKVERKLVNEKSKNKKTVLQLNEQLAEARQRLKNYRQDNAAVIEGLQLRMQQKIEAQQARMRERIALMAQRRVNDLMQKAQQRENVTETMKALERLTAQLPRQIRGDFKGYGRISDIKGEEAQKRHLVKSARRMRKMLENYTIRSNRQAIDNTVKRVTKNRKKPKELQIFDRIKEIGNMTKAKADEEADALLNKKDDQDRPVQLTRDEIEDVFLLKMFGGTLNSDETDKFTGAAMRKAREEADYILSAGRTRIKERLAERKRRDSSLINNTLDQILRNKLRGIKFLETEEEERGRFKNIMRTVDRYVNKNHDGLEMLLDNIRIKGERFTGFFHNTFYRPVFRAQERVETRNRSSLERMNTIMERALLAKGISPSKSSILNESQSWGNKVSTYQRGQEIRYKHQSDTVETIPMSKWEAITMWMQYQDETLSSTFDKMGIDDDVIANVERFIGVDGKAMGNFLLDEYRRYGRELRRVVADNDNYIIDIIDNYSPIRRIVNGVEEEDTMTLTNMNDVRTGSEKNRSLIQRVHNTHELYFGKAHEVFLQHAYQMNHYFEFASIAKDIRATFGDETVKRAIRQRTGGPEYQKLLDGIFDDILRGGIARAKFDKMVNNIIKFNTVGSLALRVPVFFKQLGSIPGYAAAMPMDEWVKYEAMFWNPTTVYENMKTILDTEYIKNRLSTGNDRDLRMIAERGSNRKIAQVRSNMDKMMILTRLGDVGAIVIGGWPLYQYTYEQTLKQAQDEGFAPALAEEIARKEAETKFSEVTARQQQDSNLFSQGAWQRSGSFAKMFTMYMTTPIQYHRNVASAWRAYFTKDEDGNRRGSFGDLVKNTFIFHVLLPQIYTAIGSAFIGMFGDDDDASKEFWDRQKAALVYGNFNSVFIAGDIISGMVNAYIDEGNLYQLRTGLPPIDAFFQAGAASVQTLHAMEEGDNEKMVKYADKALDSMFRSIAVPYRTVIDTIHNGWEMYTGEAEGSKYEQWMRLMGWSDYMIPGDDQKKSRF